MIESTNEETAVVPHPQSAENDNTEGDEVIDVNQDDTTKDEENADDQKEFSPQPMNGQFQEMNFQGQGDFNQMQMMMAMQNGMPNSFGNFPMMGKYLSPTVAFLCP